MPSIATTDRVPGKVPAASREIIPKSRAVVVKWDPPTSWDDGSTEGWDESEVQHYEVSLKRTGAGGGVTWIDDSLSKPYVVRGTRAVFPLTKDEAESNTAGFPKFAARIKAIGWDNVGATPDTETGAATPEAITTSDGQAPAKPGIPTVFGHLKAIHVQWANINNADAVVFEVHMSTAGPTFTPSSSTLATEVAAAAKSTERVAYSVTKAPGGGDLGASTWFFKLVAKDIDGKSAPSDNPTSGAATLGVSGSDINDASITYAKLSASLPASAPPGYYGTPTTNGLAAPNTRSRLISGPVGTWKNGDTALNMSETPYRLYKYEEGIWYRATDGQDLTAGSLTADSIVTGTLSGILIRGSSFETAQSGARVVMTSGDKKVQFYGASNDLRGYVQADDSSGLSVWGPSGAAGSLWLDGFGAARIRSANTSHYVEATNSGVNVGQSLSVLGTPVSLSGHTHPGFASSVHSHALSGGGSHNHGFASHDGHTHPVNGTSGGVATGSVGAHTHFSGDYVAANAGAHNHTFASASDHNHGGSVS